MSDVKDWMPKRPEFDVLLTYGKYGISEIDFTIWYAKEIESLFKHAKVYYGSFESYGPYLSTLHKCSNHTHEFLVIARSLKPKPKTDRELLEAIVNGADDWQYSRTKGTFADAVFDLILEAREAIKGRDGAE